MHGNLFQYLADDHDRLDGLLQSAAGRPSEMNMEAYGEFRKGILRHIAIEEKIVLPEIARRQGGKAADVAGRLKLDHGAIVALLVPPPSAAIVATLRLILEIHNVLEEEEGGLYELFEGLVRQESAAVLQKLRSAPVVPVLPYNTQPEVLEATRRAVARAGYEFRDFWGISR